MTQKTSTRHVEGLKRALQATEDAIRAMKAAGDTHSKELLTELSAAAKLRTQIREATQEQATRPQETRTMRQTFPGPVPTGRHHDAAAVHHGQAPRSGVVAREGFLEDPQFGFKSDREFYSRVFTSTLSGGSIDERLRPLMATAGSDEAGTYSDPYGGVLVPKAFLPQVQTTTAQLPTIQPRQIPMPAPEVTLPSRVDKDHSTSVSGGLRVYRREETATVDSSRLQFYGVTLKASSLMGLSYATEEVLRDSGPLFSSLLASAFQEAFGAKRVQDLLEGTGAGEPLGVINAPATISVTRDTSSEINTADLLAMRARCWGYRGARWLANLDAYEQLVACHVPNALGNAPLFAPGNGSDVPDTLLGRPIEFSEFVPSLADKGALILVNWDEVLEGVRQGVEGASSVHVRFVENERTFRFTMRGDARPWWNTALTPKKSSTTLSPYVVLSA